MMQAVVLSPENGLSFKHDVSKPVAKHGEALIKVIRAAICNTDLELGKGYKNFTGILGHEFLGRVEAVQPNDRNIERGQRVVGEINLVCDKCSNCKAGGVLRRNHCEDRTALGILNKDGTFAEYITLPVANLYSVPDGVSDERAVFAEPLAAAFRVIEQGLIKKKHIVAVIGDGKLGLLLAEAVNTFRPQRLYIFGHHEQNMALLPAEIEKIKSDEHAANKYTNMFDVVIEATGNSTALMFSSVITKPQGTVIWKSTCAAGTDTFNTAPFVVKELTIAGSRCGNFQMALDAMERGTIAPEKFLERVYLFQDAEMAIEHAARKGVLKIQLLME